MAKAEATVEELVQMIERGQLRLPEMQRRYVWRATRVRDLLDSLYRGYTMIEAALEPVRGIGRLTVYDTSLRIGAWLGLSPELIYLHAGTREGARALGLNWRARYLSVHEVPEPLRVLAPGEIEDCLCICADVFRALKDRRPSVGRL